MSTMLPTPFVRLRARGLIEAVRPRAIWAPRRPHSLTSLFEWLVIDNCLTIE